jgi:hypothetical protein
LCPHTGQGGGPADGAREASNAVIREPAERDRKTHAYAYDDCEELYAMTVPEENRPKTDTTDEVLEQRRRENQQEATEGRSMREALEDADVRPEDYEGER